MQHTKFCRQQEGIISSYLGNPRKINPRCKNIGDWVSLKRKQYESLYANKQYPTQAKHLLNLPKKSIVIQKDNSWLSNNDKMVLLGYNGVWQVSISKDIACNRLDFTIGTIAAATSNGVPIYRFVPSIIQKDITEKFGEDLYATWKQEVMSDISSLSLLINEMRKKIDKVIPSVTTEERSEKLCRKVGIPVEKGIAFLLPLN